MLVFVFSFLVMCGCLRVCLCLHVYRLVCFVNVFLVALCCRLVVAVVFVFVFGFL